MKANPNYFFLHTLRLLTLDRNEGTENIVTKGISFCLKLTANIEWSQLSAIVCGGAGNEIDLVGMTPLSLSLIIRES